MNILRFFCIYLASMMVAIAAPGAHGPNGEHLDGAGGHVHSDGGPRLETFTEAFELVGRLQGDELSIVIDRYETNEPVLDGKLEVEFNGIKAVAKFHADHGDYAVDDERLVKALAKPGKHSLLFTLTAGNDSDLLEGTLEVAAHDAAQEHSHFPWAWTAAAFAAALAILALLMLLRRRARSRRTS
jgi:hypothetical protein